MLSPSSSTVPPDRQRIRRTPDRRFTKISACSISGWRLLNHSPATRSGRRVSFPFCANAAQDLRQRLRTGSQHRPACGTASVRRGIRMLPQYRHGERARIQISCVVKQLPKVNALNGEDAKTGTSQRALAATTLLGFVENALHRSFVTLYFQSTGDRNPCQPEAAVPEAAARGPDSARFVGDPFRSPRLSQCLSPCWCRRW